MRCVASSYRHERRLERKELESEASVMKIGSQGETLEEIERKREKFKAGGGGD